MPLFAYEAMDKQGKTISGEVEARNQEDATDKIRGKGLYPTNVKPKGGKSGAAAMTSGSKKKMSFGKVNPKQLTMFTRQFATLMDAGLPIVRSLEILHRQAPPGMLKDTIVLVREDVEGGSSLSEAMARHPKVFNKLYSNMIKAGEAGGVLDTILNRLADFREKAERLASQVKKALIYPIAVVTIAIAILVVIIIFVIPEFETIFKTMDIGEMPAITTFLLEGSNFFINNWYFMFGVPVVFYVAFKVVVANERGRYMMDKLMLHVPIFGVIARKSSVSRFCRTLGTLISSGVPILEALSVIKGATANQVVANSVGDIHTSIREGDTIAEPLRHSTVFDDLVVNMIDVGEETGELDKMLIKVSDVYDNDVDTLVGGLTSLLEPVLIIGMGGMVGFIVIALFLPMIDLMKKIGD